MHIVRSAINIIFSLYCITLFFLVLIPLMIVYMAVFFIGDQTRTLVAYRATRAMSIIWLKLCGYSISVEGIEKIDPAQTYMFVCNHTNMLDAPITAYILIHYYKSLVKKELKYVPIFGFLLYISSVPVDRSSAESRHHSTELIVDKLRHGISFLIFPEGTRNKTSQPLKNFYSGAFKTAIMAGVPIQPIAYLDHRSLQPVSSFRFHPGAIRVKVLDRIDTKGLVPENTAELQARVYEVMEQAILTEDKNFR